MKRRTFVFLSAAGAAAGAVGLAAKAQGQATKATRMKPPRIDRPGTLKLRLDADPEFAKICCGPGKLYVTDLDHRARFTPLDWSSDRLLGVELPPREPVAIHAHLGCS